MLQYYYTVAISRRYVLRLWRADNHFTVRRHVIVNPVPCRITVVGYYLKNHFDGTVLLVDTTPNGWAVSNIELMSTTKGYCSRANWIWTSRAILASYRRTPTRHAIVWLCFCLRIGCRGSIQALGHCGTLCNILSRVVACRSAFCRRIGTPP